MENVSVFKNENSEQNKSELILLLDKTEFQQNETGTAEETDSKRSENNLELFLDDVYRSECEFSIEKEEIDFIQTGIETLVEKIVNKVHVNISTKDLRGLENCEATIIKVGSIYEGTRNKFPDEFDFIYVFCSCEHLSGQYGYIRESNCKYILDEVFDSCFHPACEYFQVKQSLQYQPAASQLSKREIIFSGYVQKHGPARLLRFIYHQESGETRFLDVDLVPAVRIKALPGYVDKGQLPDFYGPVVTPMGECLYVHNGISVTEAEIYFMKNVLSKKHVKVYKILRYLINGNGDDKELVKVYKKHCTDSISWLPDEMSFAVCTSYMIKREVILHHYINEDCKSENIGDCIIEILQEIARVKCSTLLNHKIKDILYKLADHISSLKKDLHLMQLNLNSRHIVKQSVS